MVPARPFFSGSPAIKRLNLALFFDRQDDGVCGWIDIEPDDVTQFVDESAGRWTA